MQKTPCDALGHVILAIISWTIQMQSSTMKRQEKESTKRHKQTAEHCVAWQWRFTFGHSRTRCVSHSQSTEAVHLGGVGHSSIVGDTHGKVQGSNGRKGDGRHEGRGRRFLGQNS